ncbi:MULTISPECIES: Dps family protein [Cetobacterium]|jgi:starvation-inducible DNA-binding protein|uniref:DNA starvation/stationary phase protection protein n=1 Tax=Candidatus Cetobacterium colombiensis TaxID=3073100 RepID=A0ABU4W8J9_9FUSO|nr:DNA starvation/stationary phase protection protein [Candidatus Cetobacterium colombiensis]MDX8335847.1 DNA starvation/stationary phase protection protein [Candidatus Cetobacterium colombiensis]
MENKDLVFQMNKLVGDLHVFKTKVHNFHWNLVGEHFFVIHPMLDGIMSEIDGQIDAVAERILMIGHRPFASLEVYLKHTVLAEAETKPYPAKEAVKLMLEDFKLLLAEINIVMGIAEKEDDQETLTLVTDIAASYQKHIWMFGAWLA